MPSLDGPHMPPMRDGTQPSLICLVLLPLPPFTENPQKRPILSSWESAKSSELSKHSAMRVRTSKKPGRWVTFSSDVFQGRGPLWHCPETCTMAPAHPLTRSLCDSWGRRDQCPTQHWAFPTMLSTLLPCPSTSLSRIHLTNKHLAPGSPTWGKAWRT